MARRSYRLVVFGFALTLLLMASSSHGLKVDKENQSGYRGYDGNGQRNGQRLGMSLEEAASRARRQGCHILKARRHTTSDGEVLYVFKCLMQGGRVRTLAFSQLGDVVGFR